MTQYEELLRDENAILRKRIAFLEENNHQSQPDPQIQSELNETKTKNIKLLSDIQKYKQQIELLTNKVNQLTDQLSTQYDKIDFTKLFIDRFTKETHAIFLGEVNKNNHRYYDSELYDTLRSPSSMYYDEKFISYVFMLLDGQVIELPYTAIKSLDMNHAIDQLKKSISSMSKLCEHIYNHHTTVIPTLSPNLLVDNEKLNNFIINICRQYGFQFEGKGISSGNIYFDNLYPEYRSQKYNLTFSASYTTQSGIKKDVNFTITARDIIENYTKLESFILYNNPLFTKFLRHEINHYFNHNITTANDNKTTIVTNKYNEVVYQETLVTNSEEEKELYDSLPVKVTIKSTPSSNDSSSSKEDASSSQSEKYARWTQEEIELLKQLTSQNIPPREIEKHPNIHKKRSSICNKLHELRVNKEIPSSPLRIDGWTPEEDEIIIQMLNDNKDDKAISIKLNKSLSAVMHHIRRLRDAGKISLIDRRTQNSIWVDNKEDVETLKRLIKEGYRVKDMLPHLSHKYTYAQVASKVTVLKKLKDSKI